MCCVDGCGCENGAGMQWCMAGSWNQNLPRSRVRTDGGKRSNVRRFRAVLHSLATKGESWEEPLPRSLVLREPHCSGQSPMFWCLAQSTRTQGFGMAHTASGASMENKSEPSPNTFAVKSV